MFSKGASHVFNIGDVRLRHCKNLNTENTRPFRNDPDDPSAAALKVCLNFVCSRDLFLLKN